MFNKFLAAFLVIGLGLGFSEDAHPGERETTRYFNKIKDDPAYMRAFLQAFLKGGDIHTHLSGAVYAERFLEWAAEDGLCVDISVPAIREADQGKSCADHGYKTAREVAADAVHTDTLVDGLSLRSYVPTPGWSGHDQFFVTFGRMDAKDTRFGDMLAAVSSRAGHQNISYLELMNSLNRSSVYAQAMQTPMNGNLEADYAALMAGPFGQNLPALIKEAQSAIDEAEKKRRTLLKCETSTPDPGCDVEIRFLYQVIRVGPLNGTFAGFIMAFELAKADPRVVGLNLVAPEDDPTAIRNYMLNMRMIDLLWKKKGPIDISLHAGELTLGLVPPRELRFHIREAIETGHAKRIGHGIAINYEDDMTGLLRHMAENKILVEVNLTSNDVILGVEGDDHPFELYRKNGVPVTLSTDDEGVSRIDLTHEYQRAVETYDLSYKDIKEFSRNSITYSFLNAEDKARLLADLDQRFKKFEARYRDWPKN